MIQREKIYGSDNPLDSDLLKAVKKNQWYLVKYLLEKGASPKSFLYLHDAVWFGSRDICDLLIKNGVEINTFNETDETPLYIAVKTGKKSLFEYLLERGANPILCKPNKRLVDIAMNQKNAHLVRYLQQVFPTMCARLSNNLDNNIPALSAAKKRKTSDLCELPTIATLPVFHTVQDELFFEAVKGSEARQNLKVVKEYLKNGQNPNCYYCLHVALLNEHHNQIELVDMLIKYGADLNTLNSEKETPLDIALKKKNISMVTMLLKNGANPQFGEKIKIDCCTFFASELLTVATEARKFDFIRYLLLNGTDSDKLATVVRDCWESDLLLLDTIPDARYSEVVTNLKDFVDEEFQFSMKYESSPLLKRALLIMASCLPKITTMANYGNYLPLHQTLKDICGMRIRKDTDLLSCLFGRVAALFAQRMFMKAYANRTKAMILYATETGKSLGFA
ncbi:hypothetical protein QYM36_019227 [Artemia franciscana]|uniref:Ankyrin repeat protein n=1 Tax=Artemia franciscana TaxID=6661 RepID=A0AA88H1H4_ARTSF|nr:hypothetical protein QYM36_019227 [Artemia franciscana]